MKTRFLASLLAVGCLLGGGGLLAQPTTSTPTPFRTPTPTPTSNRTADISLAMSASPDPVRVGQELTYRLTVRNGGPNQVAFNGFVNDTLPADVAVVSVSSPPNWSCFTGSTSVSCSTPFFVSGFTAEIVLVVRPLKTGPAVNTAEAGSSAFDPDFSNNSASATTDVVAVSGYLRGSGPLANPAVLFLDASAPALAVPRFRDSGPVRAGLTNPWVEIGTWSSDPVFFEGTVDFLGDLRVWMGLKNSDDAGTRFALRAEIWKNGVELVGAGETACVQGLVRDPAAAREARVPLNVFSPVVFDGETDVLSLRVSARIGTGCPGTGHASATGLRLYFDSTRTPSGF